VSLLDRGTRHLLGQLAAAKHAPIEDEHTTNGDDMSAPLAFIDTETDGVHPDRKVWEVAIIRREPDTDTSPGKQTEWSTFVEIDLSTADPFGLRVGRFYDRHPLGLHLATGRSKVPGTVMPRDEVATKVAQLTHGAHLVGAVPNFDAEVLAPLLRSHGLTPAWHYHLVDVENLAVGWLAGQGKPVSPPWSSTELTEAAGVEPAAEEERHTALGDARWAMRLYDAIIGGSR